jgi:S1-C subfamily serine protease
MKKILLLCLYLSFNFCFSQYSIKKTEYDESKIREYLNNNTIDPIEGIYKYVPFGGNSQYRLGIIKSDFLYIAVILESNQRKWKVGDVKAYFEPSATKNVYSLRWIMGDKKTKKETVAFINNPALIEFDLSGSTMLLKLFPEIKQTPKNAQEENSIISTGSGFFLSKNGYIATNAHVVKNAKSIEIIINRESIGMTSYSAKVTLIDKINDVAILKIDDTNFIEFKSIPYSIEKSTEIGEKVFTIGYPISSIMGNNFKVSNGIINANSGIKDDPRFLQISTPIQPGNSGGPLFNDSGNIVGLTTSKLNGNAIGTSVENVNYAIKSSYLANLMNMLPELSEYNSKSIESKLENTLLSDKVKTLKNYVCRIKVIE